MSAPDRFPIDVDAAIAAALQRKFRLEFDSGGVPFIVTVKARDMVAAAVEGRDELAGVPGFDRTYATLVSCLEVM